MSLRLTFNKPMIQRYFDGEDSVAVRVKIEDGVAHFLPVPTENGKDVLHLQTRKRGGAETVVEGNMAQQLEGVLTNDVGPFFTLQRRAGGWLAAVAWTKDTAPPKPEPHVRAWTGTHPSASSALRLETIDTLPKMLAMVRDAQEIVARHAKSPGRPPREVIEAKANLELFEALVEEIYPRKLANEDLLSQASDLLTKALSSRDPIIVPHDRTTRDKRAQWAGKTPQRAKRGEETTAAAN